MNNPKSPSRYSFMMMAMESMPLSAFEDNQDQRKIFEKITSPPGRGGQVDCNAGFMLSTTGSTSLGRHGGRGVCEGSWRSGGIGTPI